MKTTVSGGGRKADGRGGGGGGHGADGGEYGDNPQICIGTRFWFRQQSRTARCCRKRTAPTLQ